MGPTVGDRHSGRRFGPDDVRVLEAIAAQVSVAIGRAVLLSEVSRNAYEDPLTRVGNRRALDECLRGLEDREGTPTLLVCDLDGLEAVNDGDGHPAGDALLRGVAGAAERRRLCVPGVAGRTVGQ